MLKNEHDLEFSGHRTLDVPAGLGDSSDLFVVNVESDNLKAHGITAGDSLLVRVTDEYDETDLCVWETPRGVCIRFAYFDDDTDQSMVLHTGGGVRDVWVDSVDVRLLGVVVESVDQ